MLTEDDKLWINNLAKLLKAGKPAIEIKLSVLPIADAPDLKLYELLVVCQHPRFAVGLDLNVVRTMHRSADRAAYWLQKVVQGKIPGQFYMYCLSPAHQARIARGQGQNPVKGKLVKDGEEYGIGAVLRPGFADQFEKQFDQAVVDDADRLKVSKRRNFDSTWEQNVLMERKLQERRQAHGLVGPDGKPL